MQFIIAAYLRNNITARLRNSLSVLLDLVIGAVNLNPNYATSFKGKIKDVRIYAQALTQDQIKELRPNTPSAIQPFSWYDFSIDGWWVDRAGKFPEFRSIAAIKENDEEAYIVFDRDDRHMFTMDNEAVRIACDFRRLGSCVCLMMGSCVL
ncbi:LamG domain-containing protein [Candidatus Poribacteria bacterium]|nr:LamG domain-containing protein [Candidatus Poribacteria bacterium]MYK21616.1 LamG domain-containing protein [Candidatus Poribacteria bacterium]